MGGNGGAGALGAAGGHATNVAVTLSGDPRALVLTGWKGGGAAPQQTIDLGGGQARLLFLGACLLRKVLAVD